MDAGNLVPDEVTIGMAEDRMAQPDAENGFLLDGFPRNVSQAKALDESLKAQGVALDAVLDLEVPEDEVVKRIAGRRICRNDSSHVFHVEYSKPETEASATSAAASCTSARTTRRRPSASGSRSTTTRPSRSSTTTRPRASW